MGEYRAALPLYQEALSLRKEVLGTRHPDYGLSLNNLASLHQGWGENKAALPLYQEALKLSKEVLGSRHPHYAISLNNLAALHLAMGDHQAALPLYQEALSLRKEVQGERHPDYAISLNNLAGLYLAMGEHQAALKLYQEALSLTREVLGQRHPNYGIILSGLASLHRARGDHQAALPLLQQTHELAKEVLGTRHPAYASTLNNLASVYLEMGEHQAALPLFQETLALRKELLGTRHPHYAQSLHNLAGVHRAMGDHKAALPLLQQALALSREVLGTKHPDYAVSLNNLALLYLDRGDSKQAGSMSGKALEVWRVYLEDNLAAFSHRQRAERLNQLAWTLNFHLSTALDFASPADLYQAALVYKGLSAARSAEDRLALRQPRLAALLQELRLARADLARHSARLPGRDGLAAWKKRFDLLEARKEDLEVKLSRASDSYRQLKDRPTARAIAAALPSGAALVEFLAYTHHPPRKGKAAERWLLAWVLRQGQGPVLVRLGAAGPIEQAAQNWRQSAIAGASQGPDPRAAALLRERLWVPVSKHLGSAKLVLLSPDGELAGLPFAALPGSKPGTFLLEELTFGYLTSGRQLLLPGAEDKDANGLLALGVFHFGRAPAAARGARVWPPLPGAEREARQVAGLFARAFPRQHRPRLLEGNEADKPGLLRALKERPAYLHLATHGYFEPPLPPSAAPRDERGQRLDEVAWRTFGRNPLLVSGLVLAGANESNERGRLTAEEVAGLDLSGVRLAALSACQTALGKQAGWQGVQGLQRAFHEAGARHLLASLWSVHDAATSVLMEQFYARLWGKQKPSPTEALRQAQLFVLNHPDAVLKRAGELRAELVKRGISEPVLEARGFHKKALTLPPGGKDRTPPRSPPAWWAAFVLSGDWR
jgi:CHAT domain-containing protein